MLRYPSCSNLKDVHTPEFVHRGEEDGRSILESKMIRLLPTAARALREGLHGCGGVPTCSSLVDGMIASTSGSSHRLMGGIARIAEAEKGNTKFSG